MRGEQMSRSQVVVVEEEEEEEERKRMTDIYK
jgi:hypothetical protein